MYHICRLICQSVCLPVCLCFYLKHKLQLLFITYTDKTKKIQQLYDRMYIYITVSLTWGHRLYMKCSTQELTIKLQILGQIPYFFGYKTEFFFSFQNNTKDLDPSYKTDLVLWYCLGMGKIGIKARFHRTDLIN